MKFLFRKPAWKSKVPSDRINAISHLSSEDKPAVLTEMLQTEQESQVRKAIAAALDDIPLLEDLASSADEAKAVQQAAEKRLINLLCGDNQIINIQTRENFAAHTPVNAVREALALQAKAPSVRLAAIKTITKTSVLQKVALEDSEKTNRDTAISLITELPQLENLAKKLRTKDKANYRAITERIEKLKVAAGDPSTVQAIQRKLCESLDQLIADVAPLSALTDLENQADKLGKVPAAAIDFDLAERFERGKRLFRRLHDKQTAEFVVKSSQPTEAELAAQAKLQAAEQKRLLATEVASAKVEKILARGKQLIDNPKKLNGKVIGRLEHEWQQLAESFKKSRLSNDSTIQQLSSKAGTLFSRLQKQLAENSSQQTELLNQASERLASLQQAVESGRSQDSKIIHSELIQSLKNVRALGNHPRIERLSKELSRIEPAYQQLTSWEHYGNNSERKQLCEQMEKLAETQMPVKDKAAAVKTLQKQWREIEQKELQGTGRKHASGQGLWRRFQSAGNKAWEPCAEHFGALAEQRQNDQSAVSEFIQKLKQSAELDPTQWKQIEKLISLAYKSLNQMRDMPRKETQKLSKQLREALKPLEETRQKYWQQHEFAKKKVVESAKTVVKQFERDGDTKEAVFQMKRLQGGWKKVGPAKRANENELWQEFRALADQVFGKLNAERDQQRADRNTAADEYAEHIKALEALGNCDDIHQLDTERNRHLPAAEDLQSKADNRKLDTRFKNAVKALEQRHQVLAQQRLAAKVVSAREAAKSNLGTADPAAALDEVIRIEILAGIPSPAADQARRLELQVQRLAAKVSQPGQASAADALLEAAQSWYQQHRVPSEHWERLDARIQVAIQKS